MSLAGDKNAETLQRGISSGVLNRGKPLTARTGNEPPPQVGDFCYAKNPRTIRAKGSACPSCVSNEDYSADGLGLCPARLIHLVRLRRLSRNVRTVSPFNSIAEDDGFFEQRLPVHADIYRGG